MVVGAKRPHREHLRPAAHQQHRVAPDMTGELAPVRKLGERDPLPEMGAAWGCIVLSHSLLLGILGSVRRCGCLQTRRRFVHSAIFISSWRIEGSSRKQPSVRLVTRSVPALCTPRVVMQ